MKPYSVEFRNREYLEEGDLQKKSRMQSGYTAEQKAIAVEYYQKHGRSFTGTAKALGYPCRQLLGKCVCKNSSSDLLPLKREQLGVKYSDKQKMDAVVSVAAGEKTAKQLQAEIGVNRNTVYQWKRQLLGEEDNPAMRKRCPKESEKTSLEQETDLRAECDALKEERDRLQHQVQRLKMEKDILEKAAEIIKKGEGVGIDTLSNREKAMIIDALTCRYTIKQLLPSLHMAKSSYFYQIQAMKKDKYEIARKELRKVFSTNRQCYDYRRLHTALTSQWQNHFGEGGPSSYA